MSATEPTMPGAETAAKSLPREQRALVALLAILEGLLLVAAGVLGYFYRPQPVPVVSPLGGGATGFVCYGPGGTGGTPSPAPYPCPPVDNTAQLALLAAVVCSLVAILVLPVVIGLVSRRWQSALAAPSIPIWLALLALVALTLATNSGPYTGPSGGPVGDIFSTTLVFSAAGQLLSVLVVMGLGGLGWLTRRAFAR